MTEKVDVSAALASGYLTIQGRDERSLFSECLFTTVDRLITVDGPDGSGKGAISRKLKEQLAAIYGADNVLLVCSNRFDLSPKAREIGESLKRQPWLSPDSVRHNAHYLAASMVNYQTVISPALEAGKFVVIDSSEIRALVYILDGGTEAAVRSTLRWIKSGKATSHLLAGNRVLLHTCPDDCLENIRARGKMDYGDPTSVDEAQRRADCYCLVAQMMKGLRQDRPSNWIDVTNPRVEKDVDAYLNQFVAETIIPRLRL